MNRPRKRLAVTLSAAAWPRARQSALGRPQWRHHRCDPLRLPWSGHGERCRWRCLDGQSGQDGLHRVPAGIRPPPRTAESAGPA